MIEIIDPNSFSIEPDAWTAAVVKSHNYGRDFVALKKLLPLDLHYVGLIGPRKRRDQIMNELLEVGVTINAGFFAPAGLDLGAETLEEIALGVCRRSSACLAATRANRCGKESCLSTQRWSAPTDRRFQSGDMSPRSKTIGAVIVAAGGSSRLCEHAGCSHPF